MRPLDKAEAFDLMHGFIRDISAAAMQHHDLVEESRLILARIQGEAWQCCQCQNWRRDQPAEIDAGYRYCIPCAYTERK